MKDKKVFISDCVASHYQSEKNELVSVITHSPSGKTGLARGGVENKNAVAVNALVNLSEKLTGA